MLIAAYAYGLQIVSKSAHPLVALLHAWVVLSVVWHKTSLLLACNAALALHVARNIRVLRHGTEEAWL